MVVEFLIFLVYLYPCIFLWLHQSWYICIFLYFFGSAKVDIFYISPKLSFSLWVVSKNQAVVWFKGRCLCASGICLGGVLLRVALRCNMRGHHCSGKKFKNLNVFYLSFSETIPSKTGFFCIWPAPLCEVLYNAALAIKIWIRKLTCLLPAEDVFLLII